LLWLMKDITYSVVAESNPQIGKSLEKSGLKALLRHLPHKK